MNDHDPSAALPASGLSLRLRTWTDGAAHRLLQRAALRAPPALAARLQEEWLADLAARHGPLARLRLAIGCCWAASVIAREHGAPKIATAAAARGLKTLTAYAPADSTFFSRRSAAIVAILALHALLIYLLAIGIVHKMGSAPPPTIIAGVTSEVQHPEPPPPLPGPRFTPRSVDLPAPYSPIDVPVGPDTSTVPEPRAAVPPAAPAPITVHRVPGGPGKGFPNTADFYPDAAIRLGAEGSASVQVCVGADGRLISAPAIAQSSGNHWLDAGALALAKAGSGHYRPTTEDGTAVSSCFPVRMRFTLQR